MDEILTITSLVSLVVGAAVGQITMSTMAKLRNARKRAAELAEVAYALKQHYVELEVFMNDPAAPELLKLLLISFSGSINSRETACDFVWRYASHDTKVLSPITQVVLRELEGLRGHRPVLAASFERSLGFGFVAMLLRWTETAEVYSLAASQIVSDRYREIDFAASTAKSRADIGGLFGATPALV